MSEQQTTFVKCAFGSATEGGYTYINDHGLILKPGDKVIVEGRHGEAKATVTEINVPKPNIPAFKSVLRVRDEAADAA